MIMRRDYGVVGGNLSRPAGQWRLAEGLPHWQPLRAVSAIARRKILSADDKDLGFWLAIEESLGFS